MARVPEAVIAYHWIPAPKRETWARDESLYAAAREAVERGEAVVPAIWLNPSGALSAWTWRLLAELDRGITRLRADGLDPRFSVVFRPDIVRADTDVGFAPDFPWELVARAEDPGDAGRRFLAAAQAIGKGTLPDLENGLGSWETREGPMFRVEHPIAYLNDHRKDEYTRAFVWQIRALLLDVREPLYGPWLATIARRMRERIVGAYPGLERLEYRLDAKDKHYHRVVDRWHWPPLAEWNEAGWSSSLLTDPTPYRERGNVRARVDQARILRMARIPAWTRIWMDPEYRGEYTRALDAHGLEWST